MPSTTLTCRKVRRCASLSAVSESAGPPARRSSSDAAAVLDERTTVCASDAGSAASSSRPLNFLRSPPSLDADSESA